MKKQTGNLTLIDGPMFADKTTTLIVFIKSYVDNNKSTDILVIKPTTDNRYANNELVSHNGLRYPASECHPDKLFEFLNLNLNNNYKKIFIDEGHFFKNLYEPICTCLNNGIDIVVSGINIDYMKNPFVEIKKLKTIAKTHISCSAYCIECGNLAKYTKIHPKVDKPSDSNVVVVGGADKYAPYCGDDKCYIWKKNL